MNNEYNILKKQRYEYYKGTTEIVDNEVDEFVEDVVDVLNQKSYNINELLKIKQLQADRIAELEKQLKNATKETAKKVIDRVEELSVFDFEAYEEMDFRRYIISEMALDNILREYGENK